MPVNNQSIRQLDDHCVAIYLEVPGSQVVELQAYFEMYESLGTVRTLDIKNSSVCILTTTSLCDECLAALDNLKARIPWRFGEDREFL